MSTTYFLESWRNNLEARIAIINEMTRELSKFGNLDAFNQYLVVLAGGLSKEEIISLYKELQKSKRPEFEWTPQFLSIFECVDDVDLPDATIDEERALREAKEAQDSEQYGQPDSGYPDVPF